MVIIILPTAFRTKSTPAVFPVHTIPFLSFSTPFFGREKSLCGPLFRKAILHLNKQSLEAENAGKIPESYLAVAAASFILVPAGPFFEAGGNACPTETKGKKDQAHCDCHLNLEFRYALLLIVGQL